MTAVPDKNTKATVLLMDGAMGTELIRRGWKMGSCLEGWAMEHQDIVSSVHRSYLAAGSSMITTCTFGANRARLDSYNCGDSVSEINSVMVALARKAVSGKAQVAGDIGPTGFRFDPIDQQQASLTRDIFTEQATSLCDAGVDLLLIETMTTIQEAIAAIEGARRAMRACKRNLPLWVSMTFGDDLKTFDHSSPDQVAQSLSERGVAAMGCNCSPETQAMGRALEIMHQTTGLPVFAMPSAGIPRISGDGPQYPIDAAVFARQCLSLARAGVTIMGGCCGTTPEYIAATKLLLQNELPFVDH